DLPPDLPQVWVEATDPDATRLTDPGMFTIRMDRVLPYDLWVSWTLAGADACTPVGQGYVTDEGALFKSGSDHVDVLIVPQPLHVPVGPQTLVASVNTGYSNYYHYDAVGEPAEMTIADHTGGGTPYVVIAPYGHLSRSSPS